MIANQCRQTSSSRCGSLVRREFVILRYFACSNLGPRTFLERGSKCPNVFQRLTFNLSRRSDLGPFCTQSRLSAICRLCRSMKATSAAGSFPPFAAPRAKVRSRRMLTEWKPVATCGRYPTSRCCARAASSRRSSHAYPRVLHGSAQASIAFDARRFLRIPACACWCGFSGPVLMWR
jgi:hypothetical protein